jgi:uncharacterized protein
VKADPADQQLLLDLQGIDTALGQLAHRRGNLPEAAELDQLGRQVSAVEDERIHHQVAVDDIDRDISRLEKDIDQVRSRANRDRARLAAGTGPARELEALQHELDTLGRRQNELEDAELELMEQRETAQSTLDDAVSRLEAARARQHQVQQARDEALAAIDREVRARQAARGPVLDRLPADLLALYERVRESTGIGAALLRTGRCGGCRLELSGSERSRVKAAAPDEVFRCEECGRILVRTVESGL